MKTGPSALLSIAALCGLFLVYSANQSSDSLGTFLTNLLHFWPAWILVAGLVAIGGALTLVRNTKIQSARNTQTKTVTTAVENHEPESGTAESSKVVDVGKLKGQRYILYLRPFALEPYREVQNPDKYHGSAFNPVAMGKSYVAEETVSLDEFIGNALADYTVVSVVEGSRSINVLGVGKAQLQDEQSWREAVDWLISGSILNVVIPGHTEGSIWELARIREKRLWHKTVLISPSQHYQVIEKWWRRTARTLQQTLGITLPETTEGYEALGAVYAVSGDETSLLLDNLYSSRYEAFREVLERKIEEAVFELKSLASASEGFDPQDAVVTDPENAEAALMPREGRTAQRKFNLRAAIISLVAFIIFPYLIIMEQKQSAILSNPPEIGWQPSVV